MLATSSVLVHIPHASTHIPDDLRGDFLLSDAELAREVAIMTDLHTDDLYNLPACDRLLHPVSRLVVDPERFENDADEPMARFGMGAVYTRTHDGRPLKSSDRAALMIRYYAPHHRTLDAWTRSALDRFGRCLIVDGHSFPARALPCDLDPDAPRPEICLGTAGVHTPEPLKSEAVAAFEREGFEVAVDRPYAGSIVPLAFCGRDARVNSIMVEVRRDLLTAADGWRNEPYRKTREGVRRALASFVSSWERRNE